MICGIETSSEKVTQCYHGILKSESGGYYQLHYGVVGMLGKINALIAFSKTYIPNIYSFPKIRKTCSFPKILKDSPTVPG